MNAECSGLRPNKNLPVHGNLIILSLSEPLYHRTSTSRKFQVSIGEFNSLAMMSHLYS